MPRALPRDGRCAKRHRRRGTGRAEWAGRSAGGNCWCRGRARHRDRPHGIRRPLQNRHLRAPASACRHPTGRPLHPWGSSAGVAGLHAPKADGPEAHAAFRHHHVRGVDACVSWKISHWFARRALLAQLRRHAAWNRPVRTPHPARSRNQVILARRPRHRSATASSAHACGVDASCRISRNREMRRLGYRWTDFRPRYRKVRHCCRLALPLHPLPVRRLTKKPCRSVSPPAAASSRPWSRSRYILPRRGIRNIPRAVVLR